MTSTPPICPNCGGEAAADDHFCPHCGYYLPWAEHSGEVGSDVTQPVATVRPDPGGADTIADDGGVAAPVHCPRCHEPNEAGRTFCSVCGYQLTGPAAATEPPDRAQPARRGLARGLLIGAGVLVVLALVVVGALSLLGNGDGGGGSLATELPSDATTGTASASPTASGSPSGGDVAAIDPSTIAASASSRLDPVPEEGLSYGADNTLDGDPTTAWNHGAAGEGIGEQLTYQFSTPVELQEIEVVNGYAKTAQLFGDNGRIRRVAVITDEGTTEFELVDTMAPQVLEGPLGTTSSVTLRVLSVYAGSRYDDLALSEITFIGRPTS